MENNVKEYVYAGRRWNIDHLAAVWYPLTADGEADTNNKLMFPVKGKRTALIDSYVGDVYRIRNLGEGSFQLNDPHRVRNYDNRQHLSEWSAEERVAETQKEMHIQQTKISFDGMTLRELREKYDKTVGSARRAALLASIIQHVTG